MSDKTKTFLRDLKNKQFCIYVNSSDGWGNVEISFIDYATMERCLKDIVHGTAPSSWEMERGEREIKIKILFDPVLPKAKCHRCGCEIPADQEWCEECSNELAHENR